MSWTTPADIRQQVQRLWDKGEILARLVTEAQPFPKRLLLERPSSTDLLGRFEEARAWSQRLRGPRHLRLEEREVRHRVLGVNSLPAEA
jgi:hypothetical protein